MLINKPFSWKRLWSAIKEVFGFIFFFLLIVAGTVGFAALVVYVLETLRWFVSLAIILILALCAFVHAEYLEQEKYDSEN